MDTVELVGPLGCSDFGAQENKSVTSSTFPPLFVMK